MSRHWLALAASMILIVFGGWGLANLLSPPPGDDIVIQQLVASRIRSEMLESHRVDIASSDRHTVKPWFQGKLDFVPSVFDLRSAGFPLLGGRLEYLDKRPVAVLVYQPRRHHIDLFIWPAKEESDSTLRTLTRQGFQLVHWTQAGMSYWAVADLELGELQEFARLVQEKLGWGNP
jgi:anti-sigma factor RsiW